MNADRIATLDTFTERCDALLGSDPVLHTQVCSIAAIAGRQPDRFRDAAWFVVADGGVAVGAAAQSPPFELAITPMPARALAALVGTVAKDAPEVPGVSGPRPAVDAFAELWRERTGGPVTEHRAMRLFRLDEVSAPTGVSGELRSVADLTSFKELFVQWVCDFVRELDGEDAHEPEELIDRSIARRGLWVWCDGGAPVGFANMSVPAYGVTRVGLVYTPPELRGRGYASACVAEMSRRARADQLVPVLFTDQANATTNRIYQRIGYRPVADAAEYAFAG